MTRYGLLPTVMDIQHVIKALEVKLGSMIQSSRANSPYATTNSYTRNTTDGGTFSINGIVNRTTDINVRGWSLDQFEMTRALSLGLGSKNLLTVPWELTRLSFVIDWFVNVGSFIGSAVPLLGFTQLSSGLSVSVTTLEQYSIASSSLVQPSLFDVVTAPIGQCESITKYYVRLPGLLAPTLMIKPDFKFGSFLRCADAYSLLIQLFVGRTTDAIWRR